MNTSKLLFVGVALLVGLFVIGLALGLRQRGASPSISLADLTALPLRSLFSAPMDLGDLSPAGATPPACLRRAAKQFVIPVNQACTFRIANSAIPTRQIGLHLTTPAVVVSVALKQNRKDAFDVTQSLPADEPLTLSVLNADDGVNKPVTLTLACGGAGAGECRVDIR